MTRSSCFLFIAFFLCFSVHAYNARSIKLSNPASVKEFLSCKIGKKARPTSESFQPTQVNLIGNDGSNNLCWKLKKIKGHAKEMKQVSGKSSDDVVPFRFISLEKSISWHIPRKQQDKHPEFHADYSRPRQRPPSHN